MSARSRASIPALTILAALLPATLQPATAEGSSRLLGGMLLEERGGRVVVTRVVPGSPAARGGIMTGDVLLIVDDQALVTLDRVSAAEVFRIVDRRRDGTIRLVVGRGTATLGVMFGTRADGPGATSAPTEGVRVGAEAPAVAARDLQGTDITLRDLRGRPVLLDFWASWCPPCRDAVIGLRRIADQYGDRLVIIGVSLDEDPRACEAFVYNHHLPGHQIHDGGPFGPIGRAFGVPQAGVPHVVLIGADGAVAAIGRMPIDVERDIARLVDSAMPGRGGAD